MYSYAVKMKAMRLYIRNGRKAVATVLQLGYPSERMLRGWYQEFVKSGDLRKKRQRASKYSIEQKHMAVDHFLNHGKCIARSVAALGYPHRETLEKWIDELNPRSRKVSIRQGVAVPFTEEQKRRAVIDLCARNGSAKAVAEGIGVSRPGLYLWKKKLLGKEVSATMDAKKDLAKSEDMDELQREVESLRKSIHRLRLEHDILEKANELIKKEKGINPQEMTNREKTQLIDALKSKYSLSEILAQLRLPRSSYFYQQARIRMPDKYAAIRCAIKETFESNKRSYGYRRIGIALRRTGRGVSEKVIRRIMAEEELLISRTRRRAYSSYRGEISPAVENLVARNFHAGAPNTKWLSDITEFQLPAGKVYLSPLIDCFDGMVVSWTIGTSPDAELVNTMLDIAIASISQNEHPIVHTDRGSHYRWPGWISRMDQACLVRSMSKKACSPDNAACEGFFGRLKNEMFYNRTWTNTTIGRFIEIVDEYIKWYNQERIKLSLGGLSPYEYRQSLGLIA